jgi:galactose mutarotase-like enzyme
MNTQRIDADKSVYGVETIVLESGSLRLEIVPELGGKIMSILYKPAEKEILWRNPRIPPHHVSAGASYDDNWAGGWDELFPNDEPAELDGTAYPDHGELWTASWSAGIEETDSRATIYMRTKTEKTEFLVERWITLHENEDRVCFRYQFTNEGAQSRRYLWKLHPAMALSPGDHIVIPASKFLLESRSLGTLEGGAFEFDSPVIQIGNRTVDLRVAPPPESRELHFFYGTELKEGWCATFDPRRRMSVRLSFPKEVFPTCWFFASYGGWNDYYVGVLEPCTGYPFRLEEAAQSGNCSTLEPGATQEAEVTLSVSHNFGIYAESEPRA